MNICADIRACYQWLTVAVVLDSLASLHAVLEMARVAGARGEECELTSAFHDVLFKIALILA